MTAPTELDDAELDRLARCHALLPAGDIEAAALHPTLRVVMCELLNAVPALLAAARSLPSERRAREKAERELARERSDHEGTAVHFERWQQLLTELQQAVSPDDASPHAKHFVEKAERLRTRLTTAEAALAAERARVVALEEALVPFAKSRRRRAGGTRHQETHVTARRG